MKQFSLLALLSWLSISQLFAQAPQKMTYQAVIRNSSNTLVANTSVSMRLSIMKDSPSGTIVYSETQTATTNANGLVTAAIGAGTVISGTFSSIDWGNGSFYIQSETDPAGGSNYSITAVTQLLSVPYALYAGKCGPSGQNSGDMQYWDGTQWVVVPAGTNGQTLTFCNGVPQWGPCPVPHSATIQNFQGIYNTSTGILNISWDASAESGLSKYKVLRKDPASGNYVLEITADAVGPGHYSFPDSPAPAEGIYDYEIIPVYTDNTEGSVLATTQVTVGIKDYAELSSFTLTANEDNVSVHLAWVSSEESNVYQYKYEKKLPGETTFTSIDNNPFDAEFAGMQYGLDDYFGTIGTIQYRLVAYFFDNTKQVLDTQSITIIDKQANISNFTFVPNGSNIDIQWQSTNEVNVVSYYVEYFTATNPTTVKPITGVTAHGPGTYGPFQIPNPGTGYYSYSLVAVCTDGTAIDVGGGQINIP